MKPKKLIIIFLFVSALSLFFVTDSAFACIPGTYSLCFASNCCTTGFPASRCGVTCPLCPQRSSPYEKGCVCDANGISWSCDECCGACFTGETEVTSGSSENSDNSENSETKQIQELKPGDIASSFDPETGEVSEGEVSEVSKLTREGYFELETESGKKVKVTAEHPFLAVSENDQLSNSKFQIIDKFKNILSNTLTYKLITNLQAKVSEVLK